MLKLISILLTNGIVLFMLISCHNKTGNSKSTVNLEYENSIDSYNRQIKKFPTEKQNVSLKHILT